MKNDSIVFDDEYAVEFTLFSDRIPCIRIAMYQYGVFVFSKENNENELDWRRFQRDQKITSQFILENLELVEFCNKCWKNRNMY